MRVDDSIVRRYLDGDRIFKLEKHWIFSKISPGKHIFEAPNELIKEDIRQMLIEIKKEISNFTPLNEDVFSRLYPKWRETLKDVNIMLVVGCPKPYDAMVREHNGYEYIIFDLVRFYEYGFKGDELRLLMRRMVTHEASHICLHKRYPVCDLSDYVQKMKYIVFDEGFAHLLAYKEISEIDCESIYNEYYLESSEQLRRSLLERKREEQEKLLDKANSGSYWEKFAAISGKLFLLKNIEEIVKIYEGGVEELVKSMRLMK